MTKQALTAGIASGLGLVVLVALPLAAQEDGGLRLSFGISARVESESNPGLDVPAEPTRERILSRLNFGLIDSTRKGEFSLSAAGSLSADNDDDSQDGLIDPDLRLGLKRFGATTSFELSAFLRERDLDTLRTLILDPDTGNVVEDVLGDGTQSQTGGDVAFDFGVDGPWGGSLFAGLTDTSYSGTTSEVDNLRTYAGGNLRFNLNPVTELTAGLRWSQYDEEGDDPRDTLRPELTLRRDQPAGFASANLFAEDTVDGTRAGLDFGRSWDLPDSSFAFRLGATRGVTGDISPTGSLQWRKDLPRSTLNLGLRQALTSDDEDEETLETVASLSLSHTISPLASVTFGLAASDLQDTTTDETTQNASLSAIYSHSLPYDWVLDAGVTHRIRNEDGTGEATSDTVFLEVRRAIEWRP